MNNACRIKMTFRDDFPSKTGNAKDLKSKRRTEKRNETKAKLHESILEKTYAIVECPNCAGLDADLCDRAECCKGVSPN
jgi:hypothetical protein